MTPGKRTQFRELISLLGAAGVEFIVVGGVAAGAVRGVEQHGVLLGFGAAMKHDLLATSVALLILSSAAAAGVQPAANGAGETPPQGSAARPSGADGERGDGLSVLRDLVAKQKDRLRLSTGAGSAADRFYVLVRLEPGGGTRSVNTLVTRDGDNTFVLVRSRRDKEVVPCCVAANGIAVGLDPKTPGGLVVADAAQPLMVFAAREDGKLNFAQALRLTKQGGPRVLFDMRSVLEAALPKVTEATEEGGNGRIIARTPQATLRVQPAAPGAESPSAVRELTVTTGAVTMSVYVLGARPDVPMEPAGVTRRPSPHWACPVGR